MICQSRTMTSLFAMCFASSCMWAALAADPQRISIDSSRYSPACGVDVHVHADRVDIGWPFGQDDFGRVTLNLSPGKPLIDQLGIAKSATGPLAPLLKRVDPVAFLTVGTRTAPSGRPPQMSVWNVFFDKPASRTFQTQVSTFVPMRATVSREGSQETLRVGHLYIGQFSGKLHVTFDVTIQLV